MVYPNICRNSIQKLSSHSSAELYLKTDMNYFSQCHLQNYF